MTKPRSSLEQCNGIPDANEQWTMPPLLSGHCNDSRQVAFRCRYCCSRCHCPDESNPYCHYNLLHFLHCHVTRPSSTHCSCRCFWRFRQAPRTGYSWEVDLDVQASRARLGPGPRAAGIRMRPPRKSMPNLRLALAPLVDRDKGGLPRACKARELESIHPRTPGWP